MHWFFLLCLSFRLFANSLDKITPSTPDEIFSLSSNLLVDGFVSVSSGQISLSETDLRVKGAQDLVLKRTYIPPQILARYHDKDDADRLSLGRALLQLETKGWVVYPHLWAGYNRHSPYFQVRDPQGFVLEFEIQGNKGILKSSSYGCSNLRGDEPTSSADIRNILFSVEGNLVKITWPDGIERHYSRQQMGFYRLDREILSNGKVIRYEYINGELSKIYSCDPTEKFTYGSITKTRRDHYLGSDGREVSLAYETREIKGKVKKGKREEKISFQFPVMTKASHVAYSNTVGYNERTLLNAYDSKAYPISCSYIQNKNVPARIDTFSTPSGSTLFSYDPAVAGEKEGSTTVIYSDGAKVTYRFNKLLLLSAIENWSNEKLVNQKKFKYDDQQYIQTIETLDGDGNLLLAKRYESDGSGNPIVEKLVGDFGTFCIKRTFDNHRLISEENDDGLVIIYTYLGGTRLVTSKTVFDGTKELRKTIFVYDDANNLIEEREENKTVTTYTLYETAPHLHRIEWEEKKDWNGKLISRIRYLYDSWGNTSQEDHFGSDGQLAYVIQRTYNEKGELLDETNPLGYKASYKYNARGQCHYEEPISNGLIIQRTFDGKGRLNLLQENDHQTQFDYNASDELIEKTDYLGYTTKYHYHPVHGKPDRIEEPEAITEIIYDAFGREESRIDPYGAVTEKKYNSYGDVKKITYPNGSEWTFDYFPNGLLKEQIDPDGLITSYVYDALKRVKMKTVGEHTTVFEFDGYNLLKMTDPAGFVTKYNYDFLNRKIEEKREGRITQYGYDSLGFLSLEQRGSRRIDYKNDALGQLCKKSIDGVLDTSWRYDAGGNIITRVQGGCSSWLYDAHNRLIEKIDVEENKTSICYEIGPQVLLKKITDPRGIVTVKAYNSVGQLLEVKVSDQVVETFEYDKIFRLKVQDHLTFDYTLSGKKQSVTESGKRQTQWTYTPGDRLLTKQKPDGTLLIYEYDGQKRLRKVGHRTFVYDPLDRVVGGSGFSRKLDAFGNIRREEWSNSLWIESDYDDWDRPIERRLSDQSRIQYSYEGPFLKTVTRVSKQGIYTHTYEDYEMSGNIQSERGLFKTAYEYDKEGRKIGQTNPYFSETIDYDPSGNLIRKGSTLYTYDAQCQMTSESGRFNATYDVRYNLNQLNDQTVVTDEYNQIEGLDYDLNGNLLKPGFIYDEFDQLIEVPGERIVYDSLGRRIQKGDVSFLYIGDEEIGTFQNNKAKELKILGLDPVAIEMEEKLYVPIQDVQGTIRYLIDWKTGNITHQNDCDSFGWSLTDAIPYAYAGKRYDAITGLVYFGARYYDPSLRRWLTPDPIGPEDHSNLYQYLLNNPYRYRDPNGSSLGGYLLGLGEIALGMGIIVGGLTLEVATFGGFTFGVGMTTQSGAALISLGLLTTTYHAQDMKAPNLFWKKTEVYAPDRPLPNDLNGIHIPDTDAPHTQLGTQEGRRGKYPQAREFDGEGNPVRDIDFTDHGRPENHPNPHQHQHKPNPTGGTLTRDPKAQPLSGWSYE